ARALALEPQVLLLDEPVSSADRAAAQTLYTALREERRRRPLAICLASHQLEDAYRWADDVRALAEGKLSPVTPENLFRVELPNAGAGDLKHIRVGTIEIAVMTDRVGPAILAVAPSDIFVSRAPLTSSARNVFAGRVTQLARQRPGVVHVTADVGVALAGGGRGDEPAGARRPARRGSDRAPRGAQHQRRAPRVRGRSPSSDGRSAGRVRLGTARPTAARGRDIARRARAGRAAYLLRVLWRTVTRNPRPYGRGHPP